MLTVLVWKWGGLFSSEYVNRMRSMVARNLRIPHRFVCITDDAWGIDADIPCLPITEFANTPRCRRRMKQYDGDFADRLGPRILSLDLDLVILGDLTPLVARSEPIVCWRVRYADVFSGSFVLYDARSLDGLYRAFAADPDGFPKKAQARGVPSDQAMLNYWLAGRKDVGEWSDADGFAVWFGKGYENREHFGIGPNRPTPPEGSRIVVLGSADKAVMDEGRYPFVREHWR